MFFHASNDQNMYYSNTQLSKLGEMIMNGQVISKIDHIAYVTLNNGKYFNVYRRYNSDYNIVLETNDLTYLVQSDMTVRESIGNALYLSESEQNSIYNIHAQSVLHNILIPDQNIVLLKWTEIQNIYAAVTLMLTYVSDDQQSQVNNMFDEEYVNQVCVAPLDSPPSSPSSQQQQQQQQQQTNALNAPRKRRRSEVELLEPLPYNLRNKKQKI